MSDGSIPLFRIGARGVNVVTTPTHLLPDEVRKSQNAEYSTDEGEGGIEQRPGSTKLNATPLGNVVSIHDNPAQSMFDYTPYLYAAFVTAGTHNWRRSLDGALWENVDVPVKPFSINPLITNYAKGYPRCVTIGRYLYFFDGSSPIALHQWDGTTDAIVATIPPAISGSNLTAPVFYGVNVEVENAGVTTYTYKLVARQGASTSAASVAITTAVGPAALGANNYIAITDINQQANYQIPAGATFLDVYRTAGGATQGKIGTIPIVGGVLTRGNGSGATGTRFFIEAPSVLKTGGGGATTYSYKLVHVQGSNTGAVGTVTTRTDGVAVLDASNYLTIGSPQLASALSIAPPIGNPTVDVYRTAGGATQGKIGTITYPATSLVDNGLVGDGTTAPTTGTGLQTNFYYPDGPPTSPFHPGNPVFSDAGLVGDASVAPVGPTGITAGPALGVADVVTDGSSLYAAVIDQNNADPVVYGRILQFNPVSQTWTQIGASFPTASGNGAAGTLAFYDGALNYGTYIGVAAANTSYLTSTAMPLPAGGIVEVHTTAVSQMPTAMAVFNGVLYAAYVMFSAVAAIIVKRVAGATWSTARTGPASAMYNAYTSMGVFNGKLFAGWTSGDGATASRIESTPDGATWTNELTLATTDVVCQMVTFNGCLFVVLGKTLAGYNTTTKILRRTAAGVWSTVDDPSDDLAGCLGVVYI